MPSLTVIQEETSLQSVAQPSSQDPTAVGSPNLLSTASLLLLSLLAISINGYHPYSEDAGIYVAGIKHSANPNLYGSSAAFVTAYSQLSRFSQWNAWLTHALSLPIDYYLLTTQILTTFLLLYACLKLARPCFDDPVAQWGAVCFVAIGLSLPVAGSAVFMMDPYVTARSFSTPLTLLAICACLEGRVFRSLALLLLVILFHPLMAIYAIAFVLLLWAIRQRSRVAVASLVSLAIAAGALIQYSQRAVIETAAHQAAVASRSYYFLYRWQWYELFGLAAPLILLAAYAYWKRNTRGSGADLAQTCVLIGVTSVAISLLLARPSSHSHLIAAMQPMRSFLILYFCLFLLLGGLIGQLCLRRHVWRWALLFVPFAAGMATMQHYLYPASPHLELPGTASSNGWNAAFLWIKANTPGDALFAMDADYINAPGEDAQGFRAITERASLADLSKDGGAAAAFPQLADKWMRESTAQTNLNEVDDAERIRRLAPFHATWIILDRSARTAMACPFEDDLAKVCRLI